MENKVIEIYKTLMIDNTNMLTSQLIMKTAELCKIDSARVLNILCKKYNKIKSGRKLTTV